MTMKSTAWPDANANSANPAKPATELAPIAGLAASEVPAERDTKGRFISGNNGGGRKKGSRNRLSDTFITAIESDFAEHGPEALTKLREVDPAAYIKVVASLVPREQILKREQETDYSDATDDELADLMWRVHRNRQINDMIEGISTE